MREINNQEDIQININEQWELEWWPYLLGISKKDLIKAVKSAGPKLKMVKKYLEGSSNNLTGC
jgi:hypothetical protein